MTDRKSISKAQKARVFLAWHGRCARCCHKLEAGDRVDYDHIVPVWLGGKNEDDNLRPLHFRCHLDRTKIDARDRAHVKRLNGTTPKRAGKPIRSRGFDRSKTRKFNGTVIPRAPHRAAQ